MYQSVIHLHPLTYFSLLFLVFLYYYSHHLKRQCSQGSKPNNQKYDTSTHRLFRMISNSNSNHGEIESRTSFVRDSPKILILDTIQRREVHPMTFQSEYEFQESNFDKNLPYFESHVLSHKSYKEDIPLWNYFDQPQKTHNFVCHHQTKPLIIDIRKERLSHGKHFHEPFKNKSKDSFDTPSFKSNSDVIHYDLMPNFNSRAYKQIKAQVHQDLAHLKSNSFFLGQESNLQNEKKEIKIEEGVFGKYAYKRDIGGEYIVTKFFKKSPDIKKEKDKKGLCLESSTEMKKDMIEEFRYKIVYSNQDGERLNDKMFKKDNKEENRNKYSKQHQKEIINEENCDKLENHIENNKKRKREDSEAFQIFEIGKRKGMKLNSKEYALKDKKNNTPSFSKGLEHISNSNLEEIERVKKIKINIKKNQNQDKLVINQKENNPTKAVNPSEENFKSEKNLCYGNKPRFNVQDIDKENKHNESLNNQINRAVKLSLDDRFVYSRKKGSRKVKNRERHFYKKVQLDHNEKTKKELQPPKQLFQPNIRKIEKIPKTNYSMRSYIGKSKPKEYKSILALNTQNREISGKNIKIELKSSPNIIQLKDLKTNRFTTEKEQEILEESNIVTGSFCMPAHMSLNGNLCYGEIANRSFNSNKTFKEVNCQRDSEESPGSRRNSNILGSDLDDFVASEETKLSELIESMRYQKE